MKSTKQPITPDRLRRIPAQFSWVDHRLARDRHLDRLDVVAAALYLFLVTVADRDGLSWYADSTIASRLSINLFGLQRARADLIQNDLIAYVSPLYQVLAIGQPLPPLRGPDAPLFTLTPASAPTPAPFATSAPTTFTALPSMNAIADRATVEAHVATLRALFRVTATRATAKGTTTGKQP